MNSQPIPKHEYMYAKEDIAELGSKGRKMYCLKGEKLKVKCIGYAWRDFVYTLISKTGEYFPAHSDKLSVNPLRIEVVPKKNIVQKVERTEEEVEATRQRMKKFVQQETPKKEQKNPQAIPTKKKKLTKKELLKSQIKLF